LFIENLPVNIRKSHETCLEIFVVNTDTVLVRWCWCNDVPLGPW